MASPNEVINVARSALVAHEHDAMDALRDEQPVTNNVGQGPTTSRFIPYHSPHHNPTKGRYITSNDPRGYIPVYEYPLNGQWIMMDMDDGYILWTGIWKALGNHKADIVKMLESQPDLATQLRRVRGGYLKIQGTWLAYEVALRLARRVGWPIRHDLVPLFGPTFPTTCLSPDQPGYGTVIPSTGRRKPRRSLQSVGIPPPHSVPYPPKPALASEYGYNVGPGHPANSSLGDPNHDSAHFRPPYLLSGSPVDNSSIPFAPPVIPPVPALIPTTAALYSPQESVGPSQYTVSSTTCSPLHELPAKTRYSPYALPRRHHSPSARSGSFVIPSPLGYDKPHSLMHHASAPNLRGYQSRPHLVLPRLSLNTQHLLTPGDVKHSLQPASAGPILGDGTREESQRPKGCEEVHGDNIGVSSSGDSARSSIATPPYSDVAPASFDNTWSVMPSGLDMGHWTDDYATTHYDQGSHYYPDSTPSFSDPSNLSPRTTWSYEGYARHSPPESHLHYPAHRSMHNHYSSLSSTASFDDRRMSLADSIANSFPEPDMPIPHVAYHRYSQPQLYQPLPPSHQDLWVKERSGSFAEGSYGAPPVTRDNISHGFGEMPDMATSIQRYTPSPLSAHTPEHLQGSHDGSVLEDAPTLNYNPQVITSEQPQTTVW